MAVLWLLLVGLSSALAVDIPAYFIEGGELTLEVRPPSSEPITNILWKFKGDLLAEWVEGEVPLTYYGEFKGRTTLNTATGRLVISNTTQADIGPYSVDINNKVLGVNYNPERIKAVPKPEVVLRTLTCTPTLESCNMTCKADTASRGPVTYSWKIGDGEWKVSNKDITITKADTSRAKTITCRIQNPLTEEESEPEDNPLFKKEEPGGSGGDIAGGIIGAILAIAAAAGGVVMYKKKIGPFKGRGSTNSGATVENGQPLKEDPPAPTPTPSDNADKPLEPELEQLNQPKSDDEGNP